RLFESLAQLQLKDRYRQLAYPAMPKCARPWIEDGRQRGILCDRLGTALLIARNTKCALRPAQYPVRLTRFFPQEQVDFFAAPKCRHAIHVRVQMSGSAADSAHGNDARQQALVLLKHFKARLGKKFSAVPM